jgi:hypothetical protein
VGQRIRFAELPRRLRRVIFPCRRGADVREARGFSAVARSMLGARAHHSGALMTLKDVAELAQYASVILASLFAIYGFDAWRREHIGKRRIELAEEVLALFYQARDVLESIRSSFGYSGEGETRKPRPDEKPEHKAALDQAFVLVERYNRHIELFSRIHALRYRFMAQFGTKASTPFDDLNRVVNELLRSSQRMARHAIRSDRPFRTPADEEQHDKELLEIDRVYYGGGDDDPIAPRIKKIVDEMERTCRSVIESKGTLFAFFNASAKRGD